MKQVAKGTVKLTPKQKKEADAAAKNTVKGIAKIFGKSLKKAFSRAAKEVKHMAPPKAGIVKQLPHQIASKECEEKQCVQSGGMMQCKSMQIPCPTVGGGFPSGPPWVARVAGEQGGSSPLGALKHLFGAGGSNDANAKEDKHAEQSLKKLFGGKGAPSVHIHVIRIRPTNGGHSGASKDGPAVVTQKEADKAKQQSKKKYDSLAKAVSGGDASKY